MRVVAYLVENEMASICWNLVLHNCAYKSWPVSLVGLSGGERNGKHLLEFGSS
jgi:hypothetical protein